MSSESFFKCTFLFDNIDTEENSVFYANAYHEAVHVYGDYVHSSTLQTLRRAETKTAGNDKAVFSKMEDNSEVQESAMDTNNMAFVYLPPQRHTKLNGIKFSFIITESNVELGRNIKANNRQSIIITEEGSITFSKPLRRFFSKREAFTAVNGEVHKYKVAYELIYFSQTNLQC